MDQRLQTIRLKRQHLLRLVVSTVGLAALLLAFAKLSSGRPQAAQLNESQVALSQIPAPDAVPRTVRPADPPAAVEKNAELTEVAPPDVAHPGPSEAARRDEELRSMLAGYWTHVENGQQWIENRADGTSRMLLKLDFVASLLYGQESSMQLSWEVKDGILTHTIQEGAPQKSVDAIIRDYGKVRGYTILETTPDRMLLETRDGKKKKELWTRTQPPKEWQ
jgi:hypothetical protein